jgi:hypothetical protein
MAVLAASGERPSLPHRPEILPADDAGEGPAARELVVRTGKTPSLSEEEARQLLDSSPAPASLISGTGR